MNLFKTLPKKLLVAIVALVAVAGITAVATASYGPDRPTYTLANPADKVVFNSITDNTTVMGGSGDERTFSTGAIDGAASWSDPVAGAQNGQEVTIRAYVHNNAKANLNLVAENVTFKVELPTGLNLINQVKSTISSSNADPVNVFDTLDISAQSGYFSELEYIPGSAKFTNNHFLGGVALSDSIVTSGAMLGYDSLDGKIPGCLNFSGWVTLKVKVKVPNYQIAKTARLSGEGANDWRESVNAVPGQKIDYRIEFINNGATSLSDIRVYDKLPTYMKVVPGSVKLVDYTNPASNPFVYDNSAVLENGTRVDILNPSSYAPNSNFFILFQAEFVSDPILNCGTHLFRNVGYAQPGSMGVINDGTDVYLVTSTTCDIPETPIYTCNSVTIEKLGGRKIKATVSYNGTPASRVVFKNIEYNFGDGSTPLVSTNNPVEYTFASDGTYNVSTKVTFAVDGVNQTVTSANCAKVVTFGSKEVCKYNSNLTPEDANCKPSINLPQTGGSGTLGMFIATTMISMFAFRAYAVRKNS